MIPILAIPGTWGWRGSSAGQWYDPASPWSAFLRSRGLDHLHVLRGDHRPFVWTTDVNGQQFWRRWFGLAPKVNDWQVAGINLYAYCVPPLAADRCVPPEELHIVCHSHGLQGVLFACAEGLRVNTLISVGSPVREDLFPVADRARPHIGFWWHFYSDGSDRWQWLGEIGDGHFGRVRRHPFADMNVGLPNAGHTGILTNPALFDDAWSGPIDLIGARHGRAY